MNEPRAARHLRITGVVQGVGYRASFERRARTLGLSGWVRNRVDGSVEAVIAGDDTALDDMIAWSHRGPPLSRVTKVEVSDTAIAVGETAEFTVRPTE